MKVAPFDFPVFRGFSVLRSVIGACALFCLAGVSQAQSVKFAIGEWEPYTGQKLPGNGLATEIVTAASKAAGLAPAYEFTPWKRAESTVAQNQNFATFPYLQTPERASKFIFSDVLFASGLRVTLFKNNEKTKSLKFNEPGDLKGLNVLIVAGSDAVKKMLEDAKATVVESQQIDSGLKMLEAGRVDAVVEDQAVLFKALAAFPEDKKALFYYADKPFGDKTEYRLMSSVSYPDGKKLVDQFNSGLSKITASGELGNILKKYGL